MSLTTEFTRLPSNVSPVNYDLELQPNLKDFTFTGRVVVDLKVVKVSLFEKNSISKLINCFLSKKVNSETTTILLNSAELSFDKAVFEHSDGSKQESTNVKLCEESEVATISFSQALKQGNGKLHINYTGLLNDKLKGFYRSKYVHPSGEERFAATTQFEVHIHKFIFEKIKFFLYVL